MKDASIKKLEAELREEKAAEIRRRREITKERKNAAEERQRLEEDKVKVCYRRFLTGYLKYLLTLFFQLGARKAARLRRKAGRTKKINH